MSANVNFRSLSFFFSKFYKVFFFFFLNEYYSKSFIFNVQKFLKFQKDLFTQITKKHDTHIHKQVKKYI